MTATIPERARMLVECEASVDAQTYKGWEHLVGLDQEYSGCSRTVNEIVESAKGEWLFLIADDDLLLPGCLASHLAASEHADIVYSPPFVEGEPEAAFHQPPPGIPSTALIRTALWRKLGGYDETRDHCEDLDFFTRAIEQADARFVRIPEQVWIYRFWGRNKSRETRQ